jgi:uncharacterized protein YdhG (YjbR/CyaY superfamily)
VATKAPGTVDEYLERQPDRTRAALEIVRAAIQRALPNAEETISYSMAAYRLGGKIVLYFAGWKEHYSMYPAGELVMAALKKELAGCQVQRGTIRFPLSEPVPASLIEKIATLRAEEVLGHKEPKPARKKK